MRKTLFLLLFLLLAVPVAARQPCGLTLNEAPDFFGLKLGMTPAQVKTVFGKSLKLKIRKEGSFFENFIAKPPPAFLPGVRALYLRFFDYRLYQIEIFYGGENKTAGDDNQKLRRFLDVLSAEKNLPARFWTNANGKSELSCAGFSLVADNVLNPRIEMTDDAAKALFEQNEQAKNK